MKRISMKIYKHSIPDTNISLYKKNFYVFYVRPKRHLCFLWKLFLCLQSQKHNVQQIYLLQNVC